MTEYRAIQALIARGDFNITREKITELKRQTDVRQPELKPIKLTCAGKPKCLDWDLIAGCREMRNVASDTAKMCHPILPPKTGDHPLRGARPRKFGHYCGRDTYGTPAPGAWSDK
jgi:hypothetical protein